MSVSRLFVLGRASPFAFTLLRSTVSISLNPICLESRMAFHAGTVFNRSHDGLEARPAHFHRAAIHREAGGSQRVGCDGVHVDKGRCAPIGRDTARQVRGAIKDSLILVPAQDELQATWSAKIAHPCCKPRPCRRSCTRSRRPGRCLRVFRMVAIAFRPMRLRIRSTVGEILAVGYNLLPGTTSGFDSTMLE
jgi:hypothetical protein